MNIYLHADSQRLLEATLSSNPHALLLTGPVGIGLSTIINYYVAKTNVNITTLLPEKDEKVDIVKGTITVQSIRRLYEATRTKDTNGRIVIIDYAERMAIPAQNAFLKLLEEPSSNTRFVLLTHQPDSLLPTVVSRSQRVDLRPITTEQSTTLINQLKVTDPTKKVQLMFIAEGLPAELTRLISDDAYFESRASIVRDARTYISDSVYQRLLVAKKYKDSRADALLLLEDSMKQLEMALRDKGDISMIGLISKLEVTHRRITEQGNIRLQLSAIL